MKRTHLNAGFTMVEMIIVIAVLALLGGMMAPALTDFLDQQKLQREEQEMREIREAMELFVDRHNRLPDEDPLNNAFCNTTNNTWDECLASVSNLSPNNFRTDTWGQVRQYIHYADAAGVMLGTVVEMHYGTVLGSGPDLTPEAGTGIATEVDAVTNLVEFAEDDHADWWANDADAATRLREFQELEPVGDDLVVKLTDRFTKKERYETTLERLRAISEALGSYAKSQYNAAVIAGEADAELKNFFPPSSVAGVPADDVNKYGDAIVDAGGDMATYFGAVNARVENREGTAALETARRTSMQQLMRLLGLPDSYCCSALQRDDFDNTEESAFFYFSNPRVPLNGGGCSNRAEIAGVAPDQFVDPMYMPARVSATRIQCP